MANMDQNEDWWVVEMKSTLEGETKQDKSPSALIDRVPESLLREGTSEELYHPQVLFLGLYHFKGKERPAIQTESLKSEVARYEHLKIKDVVDQKDSAQRVNQPEIKQEKNKVDEIEGEEKGKEKESYGKVDQSGLYSVIEKFKEKEEEIRGSYVGEFNFMPAEECAWMMARDACFVLQVLESFREDAEEREMTAPIERPLSRIRYHPLMTDIVKDMLKMENQIPFWTLQEIRPAIQNWFWKALKNLSPVKVECLGDGLGKKEKVHILQLLHDYIVDSEQSHAPSFFSSLYSHSIAYLILMSICEPACDRFSNLCSGPACDHFAKPCLQLLWKWMKRFFGLLRLLFQVIIVILLSPVLFVIFIRFVSRDFASLEWERREHVPTVEELKRVGVKFQKLKGMKKGISHIHFKETNSTLYLPQVKVDNTFEVILRNLIALEICSREGGKPIIRYAILMNDLINTKEDVAVLRGEDIIINKLGNDDDIAKLWNSMVPSTEMPKYDPIHEAVSLIHDYRKKWWKVLWAQFVMTHCSKPWLVVSLFAGFTLLLLTIVQVVCLFESCQIK